MYICIYEVGEALVGDLPAFTVLFSEMLDLIAAGKPYGCRPEYWALYQVENVSFKDRIFLLSSEEVIAMKHFSKRGWTLKRLCESNKKGKSCFLWLLFFSLLSWALWSYFSLFYAVSHLPKYLQPAEACRGLKNILCAFFFSGSYPSSLFLYLRVGLSHRYFLTYLLYSRYCTRQ